MLHAAPLSLLEPPPLLLPADDEPPLEPSAPLLSLVALPLDSEPAVLELAVVLDEPPLLAAEVESEPDAVVAVVVAEVPRLVVPPSSPPHAHNEANSTKPMRGLWKMDISSR
jgi:hypothetical protein